MANALGAVLYNYFKHGKLKAEGSSISDGIGQGRVTANLEGLNIDLPYQTHEEEWLPYFYNLVETEGLFLVSFPRINLCGAVKIVRELRPGDTIVTIRCDYGIRYQSKIFNTKFHREKGPTTPHWIQKVGM